MFFFWFFFLFFWYPLIPPFLDGCGGGERKSFFGCVKKIHLVNLSLVCLSMLKWSVFSKTSSPEPSVATIHSCMFSHDFGDWPASTFQKAWKWWPDRNSPSDFCFLTNCLMLEPDGHPFLEWLANQLDAEPNLYIGNGCFNETCILNSPVVRVSRQTFFFKKNGWILRAAPGGFFCCCIFSIRR